MSIMRSIANSTGVITTLLAIYKVQKMVADQMKESDYSPDSIKAARTTAIFVTSVIVGGVIDNIIDHIFTDE